MRGVHPPAVALLLYVLSLPVLIAAATAPAHPVDALARPAATAAVLATGGAAIVVLRRIP